MRFYAVLPIFPPDNAWNRDISGEPVDVRSERILKRLGLNKPLHPDFGTVTKASPTEFRSS